MSLIFAMMTPWNDPDSKSQIGAARGKTGSSFRKHRHMMDARKLLINLLYRATAQSSEVPGWSHRQTKNLSAFSDISPLPGFLFSTPSLAYAGKRTMRIDGHRQVVSNATA
ncbi:hypothetical protein ACVSMD_51435, partial [Pseudomonas aeruginosa]